MDFHLQESAPLVVHLILYLTNLKIVANVPNSGQCSLTLQRHRHWVVISGPVSRIRDLLLF
jgi:hypothetical protein